MANETWPQGPSKKLQSIMDWLSDKEREEILKLLEENEELKKNNENLEKSLALKKRADFFWLYLDDAVKLKCGQTKFVEVKENQNHMWYKGKEYIIKLPDYKRWWVYRSIHFFISNKPIEFSEYKKSDIAGQSFSEKDFADILNFINDSLNAHPSLWNLPKIKNSYMWDVEQRCNVAYLFRGITWLDREYYLSDDNILFLNGWTCSVQKWPRPYPCRLFLKLPN